MAASGGPASKGVCREKGVRDPSETHTFEYLGEPTALPSQGWLPPPAGKCFPRRNSLPSSFSKHNRRAINLLSASRAHAKDFL